MDYIRIGSYTKNLKEFPEKERQLWRIFEKSSFEKGVAIGNISAEQVLSLIVTD